MLEEKSFIETSGFANPATHLTSQKTRLHNVHALEKSNLANSITIITPATSNKFLNYLDLEDVYEKDL